MKTATAVPWRWSRGRKQTRRVWARPPRDPCFQAPVGASRKGTGDADAKVSPRI